ncbi:MAG: glycoside hydrolase family 127 protein [Clostridia bacterium]|nr:glycoside hydrolase family 127 protein [Clostridia bacterium]
MPLKPIFDKAPLTAMPCQPLRAGMVRSNNAKLRQLQSIAAADTHPSALEGAFRLACLLSNEPAEGEAAARIRMALSAQKPDGSFDMPVADAVAVLRACWALYEAEARKPLLEHIVRWCAWAAQNWETVIADDCVWTAPADLLELLENLYRVTGKAALLTMVERLSNQTMAWSSVLNTVNSQRPTSRTITREELDTCLAIEQGKRDGYYNHFIHANSPETLADGARAAMARGWHSGSATELNAARTGWERLSRYHGAVCGGLTSGEMLEGTSPSAPVSMAAVGAWLEALSAAACDKHAEWAWEAMERMAVNAVPAAIHAHGVQAFQRVNALAAEPDTKDCFRVGEDHAVRAVRRMVRGCAALSHSAVTVRPNGFDVNLYIPGRYIVPVGESLIALTVRGCEGQCSIQVNCKQEIRAAVRLRVPAWTRNTEITVNGMESDAGKDCSVAHMSIERTWHDGDVIVVTLEESLRVMDGHHQGKYVMKGPRLMALPVEDGSGWAKCLTGCTLSERVVTAQLDEVAGWKRRGDVPADVPVLPAPSGKEPVSAKLVPYAETTARIALFPGRSAE